ncbi:hypothetical protein CW714_09730, partial [Methanophagales archaeon]
FERSKIETKAGIGSIPDGFVLSLTGDKWYIIEVELADHPLYNLSVRITASQEEENYILRANKGSRGCFN